MFIFNIVVLVAIVVVIVVAFLYTRTESRTNMKLVDQFKTDGDTVSPASAASTGAAAQTTQPK